eukprot:SM008757S23789  [mRNA]  locus=s8757:49:540:+ [translate_table: standard]
MDLTSLLIPDGIQNLRHVPRWARRECIKVLTPYLARIEADSMDEAAWALYMLFPKLVFGHLPSFGVGGRKTFQDRLAKISTAARVTLSQRRARNGSVNQPSQQSTAGILARARRFGRAGELSRAAQALCPDPLATTNDATEAILRQLHPPP